MTMYYYSSILSFFWVVSLGFLAAVGGFSFGYWNGVRSEKILCSIDGALLLWLVCRVVFILKKASWIPFSGIQKAFYLFLVHLSS